MVEQGRACGVWRAGKAGCPSWRPSRPESAVHCAAGGCLALPAAPGGSLPASAAPRLLTGRTTLVRNTTLETSGTSKTSRKSSSSAPSGSMRWPAAAGSAGSVRWQAPQACSHRQAAREGRGSFHERRVPLCRAAAKLAAAAAARYRTCRSGGSRPAHLAATGNIHPQVALSGELCHSPAALAVAVAPARLQQVEHWREWTSGCSAAAGRPASLQPGQAAVGPTVRATQDVSWIIRASFERSECGRGAAPKAV